MSNVRVHISVSADGYVAGPNQSLDNPLGEGGEALHEWVVSLRAWREPHGLEGGEENASTRRRRGGARERRRRDHGPRQVRRRPGPWDESWRGWWGEDPPFHKPVFVLTHHEREPLTLSDTTFTFVTDGIEAALDQARAAAAGKDVYHRRRGGRHQPVPGGRARRRARAPRRRDGPRRRRAPLRRRRAGSEARAGACDRGARRHSRQVPGAHLSRPTWRS